MMPRLADGMPPESKKSGHGGLEVPSKCRLRRLLLVCAISASASCVYFSTHLNIYPVDDGASSIPPHHPPAGPNLAEGRAGDGGSIASRRHACIQAADRLIASLIVKINDNVQENALAPLKIPDSVDNNTVAANVIMPGLDLQSFWGKRIVLLGDSTLYWPTKYLVSMLMHHDRVGSDGVVYESFSLDQAYRFVLDHPQYPLGGWQDVPPFRKDDGWIQWWWMRGPNMGKTEQKLVDMFAKSEKMRPEVVVANMAFHWFQLCGYANTCITEDGSYLVQWWLTYKQSWLQRVYDHATRVGAKLLLFKTANFICSDRRTDGEKNWSTGDTLYQSFDNSTLEQCADRLYPHTKKLSISRNETLKYCKYGQFTDVVSRYVNAQIVHFVREIRHREEADEQGLVVGLFNDYAVESCDTTADAIHHREGIPLRLRLLSNTIDSYLKCA